MPNRIRTSIPSAELASNSNSNVQSVKITTPTSLFRAADDMYQVSRQGSSVMDKGKLRHRVSLVRMSGNFSVHCSVENFIPSGGTIRELLAYVWQELLNAACKAATLNAGQESTGSPVSVGMDMDEHNPWLEFSIINPKEFLLNPEDCFERFRCITARFLASNRPLVDQGACDA